MSADDYIDPIIKRLFDQINVDVCTIILINNEYDIDSDAKKLNPLRVEAIDSDGEGSEPIDKTLLPDLAVTWPRIHELAEQIDNIWNDKVNGARPYPPELQQAARSSTETGMPVLSTDETTPFPIEFTPTDANIEINLRFEFTYNEDNIEAYLTGTDRAICTASYAIQRFEEGVTLPQPTSYLLSNTTRNPDLNNLNELTYNLIENDTSKINVWYKPMSTVRKLDQGVMADLYFILTPEKPTCLCPSAHRIAFAVSSSPNDHLKPGVNKNGWCPWGLQLPYKDWAYKECFTLTECNWDKMIPETVTDAETYPCPESGCCHSVIYPKHQEPVPDDVTIFNPQMLDKDYQYANTKPFTATNRPACAMDDMSEDNDEYYEKYSFYERWLICPEGDEAIVRLTPLKFRHPGSAPNELKFDHYIVVTAITVKLKGKVRPAIRKRWYDMLYYKLKHCIGYVDEDTGYSYGTTTTKEGELDYSNWEKPCSRWLYMGYGWVSRTNGYNGYAILGEKALENIICNLNYQGRSLLCNGVEQQVLGNLSPKDRGRFNSCPGCFCARDKMWNECQDLGCDHPLTLPWDGGCANGICNEEEEKLKVHYSSYKFLKDLAEETDNSKYPERSLVTSPEGFITSLGCCSLSWGAYNDQEYKYYVSDTLETIHYHSYSYDDTTCNSGAGNDFSVFSAGDKEIYLYITPEDKEDAVMTGMVWFTWLTSQNKWPTKIRVTGDMSELLMPAWAYDLVQDPIMPCALEGTTDPEKVIASGLTFAGGLMTVECRVGPNGPVRVAGNDRAVPDMYNLPPNILTSVGGANDFNLEFDLTPFVNRGNVLNRYRNIAVLTFKILGAGQDEDLLEKKYTTKWAMAWNKCFIPGSGSIQIILE